MYSQETRRLLRERLAEARERAAWGFWAARADDCDNSNILEWAREREQEADRIASLLAR